MDMMMEEYGVALLGILAGCGMAGILWHFIYGGGAMGIVLLQFVHGICG